MRDSSRQLEELTLVCVGGGAALLEPLTACLPTLPQLRLLDVTGVPFVAAGQLCTALGHCAVLRRLCIGNAEGAALLPLFAAIRELPLLLSLFVGVADRSADVEVVRRTFSEAQQLLRRGSFRLLCIAAIGGALSEAEKTRIKAD